MRQIFGLIFLFSIAACGDRTQTTNTTVVDTADNGTDTILLDTTSLAVSNPYLFDTAYDISKDHKPFIVTGYFNPDDILDTAIIIRKKSTSKDGLFIKHGRTDKSYLLKNGKDVGSEFLDFNWVGKFEIIKKRTKIWNNVVEGEIVGEDEVPDNKKIILQTDGIFIHEDEGGGGGIVYFKNGKYVWVQQD
jgi:hypothetical protein